MNRLILSPYLAENTLEAPPHGHWIYNFLTHRTERVDEEAYAVLERCRSPVSGEALEEQYPADRIRSLVDGRMLLDSERVWQAHDIGIVEIEIGTQCNWRCEYCPQREHPARPAVMPMELFCDILNKAADCASIREVSLNSYNEPTLDPYFDERIKLIREKGLRLCLYTNGSGLSERRLRLLRDSGVLSLFYINLPSADPETFRRMTGGADWRPTYQALDLAVALNMPVRLSVQGNPQDKKRRVDEIRRRWPSLEVSQWPTSDRLGLLTGKYAHHVSIDAERLFGCYHIFHSVCVDVEGGCYLCCNDYNKRSRYNSIRKKSFSEILTGEKMQAFRRAIFGAGPAGSALVCRQCDVMKGNQQLMRAMRWLHRPAHTANTSMHCKEG